jgi:glutamine amidotransferase
MCRLFGLHGGQHRVQACFWLLEAPGSLQRQSFKQPDGYGIGVFDEEGRARVEKGAIAAHADERFACEARTHWSRTFIAHLRYASVGDVSIENSHPFEQHGRIFAHNGVVQGLPELEAELGEFAGLIKGTTDSERFFALLTREIERHGGSVDQGIRSAVDWLADNLPLYSLNFVLTTSDELWAFRYPEPNSLYLLERDPGGEEHDCELEQRGTANTIHVHSAQLEEVRSVVVATERMDDDPGWRLIDSGELVHVGPDLTLRCEQIIDRDPADMLSLGELDARAAASQAADVPPAPAPI